MSHFYAIGSLARIRQQELLAEAQSSRRAAEGGARKIHSMRWGILTRLGAVVLLARLLG